MFARLTPRDIAGYIEQIMCIANIDRVLTIEDPLTSHNLKNVPDQQHCGKIMVS